MSTAEDAAVAHAVTVVIGIGNELRRDDGVGPAVAAELDAAGLPGVRVRTCAAEPAALLDAWAGAGRTVLVDAAAGNEPGRVRVGTLSDFVGHSAVSSHDMDLRQAYELGRALGRQPNRPLRPAPRPARLKPRFDTRPFCRSREIAGGRTDLVTAHGRRRRGARRLRPRTGR